MAANDVISLARAKLFLRRDTTDTTVDTQIQGYITAISNSMDEYCGPVIQRTVTGELLDGGGPAVGFAAPVVGRTVVKLRRWPAASISSVTEYSVGAGTVLVAETPTVAGDYLAEGWEGSSVPGLLSGRLFRRNNFSDAFWRPGRRNISVTYVAGRFVNTAAAQDTVFERAALTWLRLWWGEMQLSVTTVGSAYDVPTLAYPKQIPDVISQMLFGEWRNTGLA